MATSETQATLCSSSLAPDVLPSRVVPLEESDCPEWDRFVVSQPRATFFHQLAWKRVMEKTYGYQPYYFCSKRGDRITGIAAAFLVSSWMTGRCLISLPFAVYGGVCAEDQETERALTGRLEELAAKLDVQYLELRNREGQIDGDYIANERYATFTLPLSDNTQAVYDAFPKDIRYMLRKAEKAGLRAQHGFDQLDQFYRLMNINLRRLGTPAFPRALYENLIREYPGQIDLTLVYLGEEPVAGGMSFIFRDWFQPYYVGSEEKAKPLAANNFLWWEMIRFAAGKGLTTFDFGRSKKGSGNYDFKKKWNPRIENLNYQIKLFRRKEMPNFSPANPKFEIATNVWKKLPIGLTRALGPRVVRWFP
jgi:FemAB-related protein (PEP-CTERM system-associated)